LTELTSIEVREGWKKYYLFGIIFCFIFLAAGFIIPSQRQESIDFVFTKWTLAKLPFFALWFAVVSICSFYYFDNRVKVRIDTNGIWTLKYKNTYWDDIWYFSSTVCKMRSDGDIYYLKIRLKDTEDRLDKELKIKFRRMDKDFGDVRAVMAFYAAKYNIQDLGHENKI